MDGKVVHFDVVFNAIHGSPGEDGQLAEILGQLQIRIRAVVNKLQH